MSTTPSLTIGLVVRNGAKHLCSAVDSIRRQTFSDYRIIACDNASTDETPGILSDMIREGLPLRIVRHPHDIGWLRNFICAAEQVQTEFFCWATHDDLRDQRQLQTLIDLLRQNPTAGLACSAVRNMDPDGTPRDIRPETRGLCTTVGMNSTTRVLMYLNEAPGTPFYGIFRASALRSALPLLRRIADVPGPTMIGVDMAFIANILRDHDLAITHEPLLHFRRGGWSHQLDHYGSLRNYLRQFRRFNGMLKLATRSRAHSMADRCRIDSARWRYLVRYMLSAPMRRMTWHYLSKSIPLMAKMQASYLVRRDPAFRRLARRFKSLPRDSRVALFGGGKHTRRCLGIFRNAAGSHIQLVGVIDDAAMTCASINGLQMVMPANVGQLRADVVVVSSDAYETALFQRARKVLPSEMPIWSLYDQDLDTTSAACSASSVACRNARISSSESVDSRGSAKSGIAA